MISILLSRNAGIVYVLLNLMIGGLLHSWFNIALAVALAIVWWVCDTG